MKVFPLGESDISQYTLTNKLRQYSYISATAVYVYDPEWSPTATGALNLMLYPVAVLLVLILLCLLVIIILCIKIGQIMKQIMLIQHAKYMQSTDSVCAMVYN